MRDRGQATVEFAIALPLVVVLVLGVIQIVVVTSDQLAIELAAREAARAAVVAASPAVAADRAARAVTQLRPLSVSTISSEGHITVHVGHRNDTDVALIGIAMPGVDLEASVTMALEPP